MGRPPLGKVAMTGAERVRRYRQKHHVTKPVTKHLEARIVELEAELVRTRAGKARPEPPPLPGDLSALKQAAEAKKKIKKARGPVKVETIPSEPGPELATTLAQLAKAKATIRELRARLNELRYTQQRKGVIMSK